MSKREIQAFIKRLKLARAAVVRGNTGCQTDPKKCWYCAMRYRSGVKRDTPPYWKFEGPTASWSFDHSKEEVLMLFDRSIAALM